MAKIADIFNIEKGVLQSSKCTSGKYTFITAAEDWKTHNDFSHDCEALIFAAAASGSLGRTHYFNGKFISSDLCFILTSKNEKQYPVDLSFYHFLFNSIKNKIVKDTKTGTSKEAINLGNFSNYEIPYFGINEQKYWKEQLQKLNNNRSNLINELQHQTTLIKKLRQSILQNAVQGKLVPQNSKDEPASVLLEKIKKEKEKLILSKKVRREDVPKTIVYTIESFDLPKGWAYACVEQISYCLDFMRKPINKNERLKNPGSIPYYGANGQVDVVGEYLFDEPLVLVLEDETFIGRTKPFSYIVEGKTWVNNHAHVLKPSGGISVQYLNLLLCYYNFPPLTAGTTNRQKLTKTTLLSVELPIAPLLEQQRIVKKVEELMSLCDELEKEVKSSKLKVEQLMQSVLREAFEPAETSINKSRKKSGLIVSA